ETDSARQQEATPEEALKKTALQHNTVLRISGKPRPSERGGRAAIGVRLMPEHPNVTTLTFKCSLAGIGPLNITRVVSVSAVNTGVGISQVRVVEDVKGFHNHLHLQIFVEGEVLRQRGVDVEEPWSPQSIASNVAERVRRGPRVSSEGVVRLTRGLQHVRRRLQIRHAMS